MALTKKSQSLRHQGAKRMKIIETGFEGLYELEPLVFGDERGYFFESYRRDLSESLGIKEDFVQDNQSFSVQGTLRGLHYQKDPHAQAKLVSVTSGKVLDVAVDIRRHSPTYGRHHKVILDAEKHNMFLIPAGFAHGFLALEDSVFVYKCSNYYHKESEGGIHFNDSELNINWKIPENELIISEKDMILPSLKTSKN